MTFELTTHDFQGPIDALLGLIEKRKLSISDFALAEITDEYIRFIHDEPAQSISDTTHFIFVASTLTLIKSKSLLPGLELTEDEEENINDLKKRLELLQAYVEKSKLLKEGMKGGLKMFYAKDAKKEVRFSPHESISLDALYESLSSLLQEKPVVPSKKKEVSMKITVHIEEIMNSLEKRIKDHMQTDFKSFMTSYTTKANNPKEVRVYQVVGFLALLELVRNGLMKVMQQDNFMNIDIEQI